MGFWDKFYGIIIIVYDFTNKILWLGSNCFPDSVMRAKIGKFRISIRKRGLQLQFYEGFTRKNIFSGAVVAEAY